MLVSSFGRDRPGCLLSRRCAWTGGLLVRLRPGREPPPGRRVLDRLAGRHPLVTLGLAAVRPSLRGGLLGLALSHLSHLLPGPVRWPWRARPGALCAPLCGSAQTAS